MYLGLAALGTKMYLGLAALLDINVPMAGSPGDRNYDIELKVDTIISSHTVGAQNTLSCSY